jgi:hypothetical protein
MPRTACVVSGFVLTSLLLVTGCNSAKDRFHEPEAGHEVVDDPHGHGHEEGPHGGHLIELGDEEYHAELVFDEETRKTTVYILDAEAKSPHPIQAQTIDLDLDGDDGEIELTLAASPLENDGEGMSSRFELAADKMLESIKDEEDIKGHLHIKIGETEYIGEIEHDHGEGEGHQHDDDKDDKHKDDEDKPKTDATG